MKREFLKEQGLTDEQVEAVMKSHGLGVQEAQKKAKEDAKAEAEESAAKLQAKIATLEAADKELKRLKADSMSAEEQVKAAAEAAEAERVKYLKLQSEAKATAILAGAGVEGKALEKLLPGLVSDDVAVTEQRAKDFAAVLAAAMETTKKATEEEVLKATPEPPTGAGSAAVPAHSAQKQLEAAQAAGNPSEVAYWTRIVQQEAST